MMKILFGLFLFFPLAIFSQGWIQLPDLPGPERDDGVAVVLNSKAYFGTGLRVDFSLGNDFYVLDLNTLTWSAIASMPSTASRQYASSFRGPGSFYVVAGQGANGLYTDMYKYDVASNTWTTVASLPGNGILGMCCLEFGDKIIFVGGRFQDGSLSNNVWEYTISTDTWLQKNNFPFGGRWRASAAVLNSKGYLLFGLDPNDRFRKDLYEYNPTSDTWTKLSDFPLPGRTYAAMQATGNKLTVFAGIDSLSVYYNDAWRFDPVSNSWSQQPALPSFGRKGGMSAALGDRFFYTCGVTATERLKQTWLLDLPTGIKNSEKETAFSVSPNPFNDKLSLNTTEVGKFEICLLNASGREFKKINYSSSVTNTFVIETNDLERGLYFLKVTTGTITEVRKVIKE